MVVMLMQLRSVISKLLTTPFMIGIDVHVPKDERSPK